MKLVTVKIDENEQAAVVASNGLLLIDRINRKYRRNWPTSLFELIESGQLEKFKEWVQKETLEEVEAIPVEEAEFAPLYRRPRKIFGIGLNYTSHPLAEAPKDDPVSFIKPDTTLIGPDDAIHLPIEPTRTTAEGELAIIIGKRCSNISEDEAPGVIAGYTTALDMTESLIHSENPRFLTRAKSFDTFFSFGPEMITTDEVANVEDLVVSTVLNGKVEHTNSVANMIYNPWYLLSFHSKVMTFLPGDIILTGTPGPVVIREGDVIECQIDGFVSLRNKVQK